MNHSSTPRMRRRFIRGAGALCAGAVTSAVPATALAGPVTTPSSDPTRLNAARFRECVGSRFEVTALQGSLPAVAMTLADVSTLSFGTASPASRDLSFSIDLVAAKGPLRQDTYAVSHPLLGEFVALLVPSADGLTLTGVFHRYS